ncbi:MAG: hypothetical protein JWP25_6031, partial [Bradyrhizobium sp.]|nr:hypothetical protein [Bradyrhizobium sp.]
MSYGGPSAWAVLTVSMLLVGVQQTTA